MVSQKCLFMTVSCVDPDVGYYVFQNVQMPISINIMPNMIKNQQKNRSQFNLKQEKKEMRT